LRCSDLDHDRIVVRDLHAASGNAAVRCGPSGMPDAHDCLDAVGAVDAGI